MIVLSVHVPKAAGTTLRYIFQFNFSDRLILDYSDDPLNPLARIHLDPARYFNESIVLHTPEDQLSAVIHGHYHVGRYQALRKAYRVTFLRDPIDQIISMYFHWKSIPKHDQPLHAYFLDQGLDIVALAKLPLISNILTKTYFGGIDMRSFDFIGFYDRREQDLLALAADLNMNPMLNVWRNKTVEVHVERRSEMRQDRRLMSALTDVLKDEIDFYESMRKRK